MKIAVRALVLAVAAASASADVLLTMKSGESYRLKSASVHKNGVVTFTTIDGRLLSVKEKEVAREAEAPPATPPKHANRGDTRQLGAFAREQRQETGKSAPVAGKEASPKTQGKKPEKKPEPPKTTEPAPETPHT